MLRGLKDEATLKGDGASHAARISACAHLGKHVGLFPDTKLKFGTEDGQAGRVTLIMELEPDD